MAQDIKKQKQQKLEEWEIHLTSFIAENCPNSREKSLAITKLEECIMWASKAIAKDRINGTGF